MQYAVACRAMHSASSSFSGSVPRIRYALKSSVKHPSRGSGVLPWSGHRRGLTWLVVGGAPPVVMPAPQMGVLLKA